MTRTVPIAAEVVEGDVIREPTWNLTVLVVAAVEPLGRDKRVLMWRTCPQDGSAPTTGAAVMRRGDLVRRITHVDDWQAAA